jgi:hypothetical protein
MKALTWSVVYARDNKPLAAFCDFALAEAYSAKAPELGETIVSRSIILGGDSSAIRLLRDIVSNDYTVEGDRRMSKAIAEARELLKITDGTK